MSAPQRALWHTAEIAAWLTGVACLAVWTIGIATRDAGRRQALALFEASRGLPEPAVPDQRLWSPERVRAWAATRQQTAPTPLAVLRIRRLGIEVPVLEGTDDWTLNRAAGHIADTAAPGEDGNSGIAAHRDGFFRALKDARVGDVLELETRRGALTYRVDSIWVVQPEDVSVLDPTPRSAITLVTCFPFYFVGSAPQRYIVRAVRVSS
jgi:sortase A